MENGKNRFYHVHKLITFLFLFFQIFTGREILLANAADISNENIVTNVTMEENFTSGDGSNDHNVTVYAEFTLPNTAQSGDTFSIVYDEKLSSIGNDTDIPVKSANGIVIGQMDIDATTRTVKVTLNDNVTKYNNIKGTLSFEREADRSEFTQGSGEYSFNFITGDKTITAKSNIQFTNSGFFNHGLAKYPVSYDPETGLHKWVIIVNPQQANMPVSRLTDRVQSGNMTIESYKVYTATTVYESLGYELGEFLGGANVSAGSFNINLDSGRDSYIIEVYTKGDPKAQNAFENSATIVRPDNSYSTANAYIYQLDAKADAEGEEVSYEFYKIDTSKNPLEGAEFTATNDYDQTEVHTSTSDAEGKVTFTGLNSNSVYTIKETKAPNGYVTDESFYAELSFDDQGNAVVTLYNAKEGTYLDGNTLHMVNSPQKPGMTVEKSATRVTDSADVAYDEVKFKAEGDKIYYSFTFTNTGTNEITAITFTDEKLGIHDQVITLDTPLAPKDSYTYEVPTPYVVTADDVTAGSVFNTVTSTGTTPDGETPPGKDENEVPGTPTPAIDLVKTATAVNGDVNNKVVTAEGDVITYEFTITNTGNMPLINVVLDDPMLGGKIELQNTNLAVGESMTVTKDYIVTAADVEKDNIPNTATVTGDPEDPNTPGEKDPNTPPVDDEDKEDVPVNKPAISLVKTATAVNGDANNKVVTAEGDVITYEFTITNTGNMPLINVVLDDPMLGGKIELQNTNLAVGESMTVTKDYTATAADVEKDNIPNTATVTGDPEDPNTPGEKDPNTPPVDDEDKEDVPVKPTPEETTTTSEEETTTTGEITTEEPTTSETTTSIVTVTVTETTSSTEAPQPELYDASIKKVDQHGNAVKGVTFELYRIIKTMVEDAPVTVEPAAVDTSEVDAAIEALNEQIANLQNQVAVLESEHGTVIPSESVEPIVETSIVPEVTAEDGTIIEESYVTEVYIDPVTEAPTVIDHSAEIESLNAQIVQLQEQVVAKLAEKTAMTTEATTTAAPVERIEEVKIGSYKTDASGLVQVKDLVEGEYYFVETAAPAGYDFTNEQYHFNLPNDKPVLFTITNFNNNTTTVETETSIVTETTEETTTPGEEETTTPGAEETTTPGGTTPNKPTTPNTPNKPNNRKHLPNTGESIMNKIVTTTIGIGLLAGGFFVFRSKREHE